MLHLLTVAWGYFWTYGPQIFTVAGVLMAVLPQGTPGSAWDQVRTLVNYLLAFNWGHATNIQEKH